LSGKKWVILKDESNRPRMVINADGFLRDALFNKQTFNPFYHCHRPIIATDPEEKLGIVIPSLRVHPTRSGDDVIDEDIILFWGKTKKVITGADILGRLLRGIVKQLDVPFRKIPSGD
ncbi:MAG TPA: Mg2+ and Co2+ transporter CorB, partial [Nitrospiria bacterium]|nr:Mg2+ and Co2+ transporter CorB [Nitrospiria bacterium]